MPIDRLVEILADGIEGDKIAYAEVFGKFQEKLGSIGHVAEKVMMFLHNLHFVFLR
jgi:hypothetical protein